METLYQYGKRATLVLIADYLDLLASTSGLEQVDESNFENPIWKRFLLSGKGLRPDEIPTGAADGYRIYQGRKAITHDIQAAVSGPLYEQMREHARSLVEDAARVSNSFTHLTDDQLQQTPELLPVFMHASSVFSMSVLRKELGAISDTAISGKASARAAAFFNPRFVDVSSAERIVERLGSTIEGQVRDLLGRYLLESVVQAAFERLRVPFQREEEYAALGGVVYDHRADFVVPSADNPLLFVEVRRSSARHSSLYAKDKMFSAINWKGRHPQLIGVLVVDGEWSSQSMLALARVFDYVLPVSQADELARVAAAYLRGDSTRLLRLIKFEIEAAGGSTLPPRPGLLEDDE